MTWPAALAEQSSLVTVTNGAEYRAPSCLDGGVLRRSLWPMRRSHRRDDESLVLDSNPNAFSGLESRVLKPYAGQFDPREVRRVQFPVRSDGAEDPRQGNDMAR